MCFFNNCTIVCDVFLFSCKIVVNHCVIKFKFSSNKSCQSINLAVAYICNSSTCRITCTFLCVKCIIINLFCQCFQLWCVFNGFFFSVFIYICCARLCIHLKIVIAQHTGNVVLSVNVVNGSTFASINNLLTTICVCLIMLWICMDCQNHFCITICLVC